MKTMLALVLLSGLSATAKAQSVNTSTITVQTIGPAGGRITFNPANGPIIVDIPAGAFTQNVTITLRTKNTLPPPNSPAANMTPTGIGAEVGISPNVAPLKDVSFSMGYMDSMVSRLDEKRFFIARYDCDRAIWVPLYSNPDSISNSVQADSERLNCYVEIMQSGTEADASAVRVFPNPFRPSQGHRAVTFVNVPVGAKIILFTLLGEKVREMTPNASGIVTWNGNSDNSRSVASGVYFARIEGAGPDRTMTLAVQR